MFIYVRVMDARVENGKLHDLIGSKQLSISGCKIILAEWHVVCLRIELFKGLTLLRIHRVKFRNDPNFDTLFQLT
jgi:hypothetical protein